MQNLSTSLDLSTSLARLSRDEERAFRRIYVATFPLFLVAALIGRVMAQWRQSPSAAPNVRKSIFGEASALANTAIPFAFMK
jgi:hypothetical protein